MSGDAADWISYARENLRVSDLCVSSGLFNPCIQNAQQAIEKALKALIVHRSLPFRRIHSIDALRKDVLSVGLTIDLTNEECDLLDSVYLPSKYPLGSVVPDYEPDEPLAKRCVAIAGRIIEQAERMLQR
jgi:HEPN domain-containing protein